MNDEQKKELAELRAKREALREAREKRDAVDPVEAERKALAEEETIYDLEQKHGPIGKGIVVRRCGEGGPLVIAKKPNVAEYQKFRASEAKLATDVRAFVRPNLVHPAELDAASALLDDFPALWDALSIDLAKLCGFDPKA